MGKGKIWVSHTKGVTRISMSTGVVKGKFITIEYGL